MCLIVYLDTLYHQDAYISHLGLLNSKYVGTIRKYNTVTSDSDLYLVFIRRHQYEKWLCKEELQKTMTFCPNNM